MADGGLPRVIAHRGASDDAPEHTLAAYRTALAHGADGLECDVRLTADGHLVCVHDRRVDRTSNGRGVVSALELAELSDFDFSAWPAAESGRRGARRPSLPHTRPAWLSERGRDEPDRDERGVLTLRRLLDLAGGAGRPVELLIETKHPTRWAGQVEQRLAEVLEQRGLDRPGPLAVRVMSFSDLGIGRMQALAPAVPTVLLLRRLPSRLREPRLPDRAPVVGPWVRALRRDPEFVARAHDAGLQVFVWTVDRPADVELCAKTSVDAIITNRPAAVRQQLGAVDRG